MRKKVLAGFIFLAVGIILSGFGMGTRALNADSIQNGAVQTVTLTLFIGIAFIILSAILFIRASGEKKS
jgi:hypothetical protein